MSIVQLKEGNCQNCYKCIRNCPVKSIEFKNGNAAVIEKECILCGECIACCPQNTKYARNDISEVRALLSAGHPVAVSLAPSWKAYYENVGFDQMSGMLKKLGFSYVGLGPVEEGGYRGNLRQCPLPPATPGEAV